MFLAILFEDAIILGAENDNVLYTSDSSSPFSFPFSVIQRTVSTDLKLAKTANLTKFFLESSIPSPNIASIN